MNIQPHRAARHFFRTVRGLLRRLAGGIARPHATPAPGEDSYVGLFQGVIETDSSAPAAHLLPDAPPTHAPVRTPRPAARPATTSRTSGFVRLEVNAQKKATGCFLFFVDGKVLSGAIEGASEQTGFVEASFRLDPSGPHGARRPVAAVGRLTLETRCARRASGPAEDMTIRFV